MKLYFSPGACSIGIHFLLEEIGKPYTTQRVNLADGDHYKPEFLAVNPKSKVPALGRDDGTVLTEWPAIAFYLAKSNPELNLLPTDLEGEAKTHEVLAYITATIHMRGFTRMFKVEQFTPNEADYDKVRARGREIVVDGLANLSADLGDKQFYFGDHLTIADSALFFILFWAVDRVKMDVPANLVAYYQRLKARPAAQKAFAAEGIVLS